MKPNEKIARLQALLKEKELDAWLIPSADPHQSEYVAAHWQIRAWLSGFEGSAGTLIVTNEKASLWADPRYHIRAAKDLSGSGIDLFRVGLPDVPTHIQWLQKELKPGSKLGFDGRLLSFREGENLTKALGKKSITISSNQDLIGEMWSNRPSLPNEPIRLHENIFAGKSRPAKFEEIRQKLKQLEVETFFITALDEIAWLFNIRGNDVLFNPVAYAYGLISDSAARLFIDPLKVPESVKKSLETEGVRLANYGDIFSHWQTYPADTTILVDPDKTNFNLVKIIKESCQVKYGESPINRAKSHKNDVELASIRQAHIRDGLAMVRWLYWLDKQTGDNYHTEITLADKLTEFRAMGSHYQGLSFGTISGYGSNSAVGHYSPQPETTPKINHSGILLIDSGGQYLDGTTDITRTITLGQPTEEQRSVATAVLKSLIKLSSAKFPKGTTGHTLDALAREPLWQQGCNCRHGIGHGVGAFLNVHEGPQRLAPGNQISLEEGMVTTIEPGVYFEGEFGVRFENIVIAQVKEQTAFGSFIGFETVTLCPFDLDLIDPTLLNSDEKKWLNDYHERVYNILKPFLTNSEQSWLKFETRKI